MRRSAVEDCRKILEYFGIDSSKGNGIDVGGTEEVYLDEEKKFVSNPLRQYNPGLRFLDGGFNVEVIHTKANDLVDFLDPQSIVHLKNHFDFVYCFDTLEHVSNPFLFCENLVSIAKPGGYIYVATVFEWPYHPSPEDHFRYSPTGLLELFQNSINQLSEEVEIIWCGWGTDRRGVSLLGKRFPGKPASNEFKKFECSSMEKLLGLSPPDLNRVGAFERTRSFLGKPWSEKVRSVRSRFGSAWLRIFPFLPVPVRLPFGMWWLVWNDVMGRHIFFRDDFEQGEQKFLQELLQPGMVVLDIGAHHGLYTLLAVKRVGEKGTVVAFEPSEREMKRLKLNLSLNRCRNVRLESVAVGKTEGRDNLFVCLGVETGCNSLRPPVVNEKIKKIQVDVVSLDSYIRSSGLEKIDFIKLDVEGAEMDVILGARTLLRRFKPVVMCEMVDVRSEPWGYRCEELYDLVEKQNYRWFSVFPDGSLRPCEKKRKFHENLIAIPEQKESQLESFINRGRSE